MSPAVYLLEEGRNSGYASRIKHISIETDGMVLLETGGNVCESKTKKRKSLITKLGGIIRKRQRINK